jgi:hypothetical protein
MSKDINPRIGQLQDSEKYRLVKTLRHDEVVHFVVNQLKHLRLPMLFFYGFTSALLLLMVAFSIYNYYNPIISWRSWFLFMLYGILSGMILVIPFHEGIHGLAYRIAGAKKVKYGMDLKQMLFYASAPGFVAGSKDFMLVALFPFTIINIFFAAGIVFGEPHLQWGSLVALFVHSTLCIGDFAMINYLVSFPDRKLYTYDDELNKTSYFFIRC